jgi:hypothetical protein
MTEQEKLQLERKAAQESAVAFRWMRLNPAYHPCDANAGLMGAWLKENNLEFNENNLTRAATALEGKLVCAGAIGEPVAPPPGPTLDSVAPWPMRSVRLETPSDIKRISGELLQDLRRGPHGEALKRRLQAIQDGYRNPVAAPAVSQEVVSVDDGLPPVPAGIDPNTWPSSVADIEAMPRESFRLLYHSRKHGEAFRKRIEAIYANERGQR